jgi:hypothetical protein
MRAEDTGPSWLSIGSCTWRHTGFWIRRPPIVPPSCCLWLMNEGRHRTDSWRLHDIYDEPARGTGVRQPARPHWEEHEWRGTDRLTRGFICGFSACDIFMEVGDQATAELMSTFYRAI